MDKLTDEQRENVKHRLAGTADSVESALEHLNLDIDINDAEDQLLDGPEGVEICAICGWWHWSHELEFDENKGAICESCR